MSTFKRRDFLKSSAVAAAAAGVGPAIWTSKAHAQWSNAPEKGAKLRVLRWKRFVQGDEDMWTAALSAGAIDICQNSDADGITEALKRNRFARSTAA